MEINIQNTKIELIRWLTHLDDKSLIQKIVALKDNQSEDWWDETSVVEKKSIDKGISDAEKGKLNSHSNARKTYGKWL